VEGKKTEKEQLEPFEGIKEDGHCYICGRQLEDRELITFRPGIGFVCSECKNKRLNKDVKD